MKEREPMGGGGAAAIAGPRPSPASAAVKAEWLAAAAVAAVVLAYLLVISAGTLTRWPTYDSNYSHLADGFAGGQLSLAYPPDPGLFTLADPYDPAANAPYRLHDVILYGDQYYLFWGPVPALLLLPAKFANVDDPGALIGSQYLVFPFAVGTVMFGALLLRKLWGDPAATGRPWWTLGAGVLGLGFALPLPFLLARAAAYEASILGGQCFLLAGLWALAVGLDPAGTGTAAAAATAANQPVAPPARTARRRDRAGGGDAPAAPRPKKGRGPRRRPRVGWLLAAGICLSLAVGCRASLAIGVTAVAAMATLRVLRGPADGPAPRRRRAAALAALGVPLVAAALLLAGYNYARFGSPLEFGQRYQLAGTNLNDPDKPLLSARYLLPNLFSYLFRPYAVDRQFPHVAAAGGWFPAWVPLPPKYESFEPIVGLLIGAPYLLLAGVPTAAAVAAAVRRRWADANGPVVWVTAASALGFVPALLLVGSTMRYLADLTPGLAVAAGVGLADVVRRTQGRPPAVRRAVAAGLLLILAYGVVVGLLLATTGYRDMLQTHNPALLRWLREHL